MKSLNLKVRHRTTYTFSTEVFLEPHILLFRPGTAAQHHLLKFDLNIHPTPAGNTVLLDPFDNLAHHVWFNEMTQTLVVEARSVLEMRPYTPLDFLIYPFEAGRLGYAYPPHLHTVLRPYLEDLADDPRVAALAAEIEEKYGSRTIDYIVGSTEYIHQNFERILRVEGHAMAPGETIAKGEGSCRDLSRLHMAILRRVGLAARFVSGYLYLGPEADEHELHAWTEVFVPGGGWVGADPTIGLLSGNDHIRLATAYVPHLTLPIQGTFRGKATVQMETNLEMTAL